MHVIPGFVAILLGCAQPLIAWVRPPKHPKQDPARKPCNDRRTAWEWLHYGTGYVAVALGLWNIAYGAWSRKPIAPSCQRT